MSAERQTRIFGAVLLEQRKVMEELAGREVIRRVLQELPADVREEYEGLTMLSWCRHSTATTVTTRVGAALGRLPEQFQAEVVRSGVERTLRGVWRVMLRLSSDEALIKRTALMYSKTCDRGRLRVVSASPTLVELELSEWPDIPNLDIIALSTGIETVLRVVGRSAQVTWRRDDEVVRFRVRAGASSSSRPPGSKRPAG